MNKITGYLEKIPVLTAAGVSFVLGVVISGLISIPFFVLSAFGYMFLIAGFLLRREGKKFILAFLLISFILGVIHTKNYLRLPNGHIGLTNAEDIEPVRLLGIVDSDPVTGERKTSFVFRVKKIISGNDSYDTRGFVLANVFKRDKFSYGEELILEGNLYKPFNYVTGSNFYYREFLKNQGIYYILSVKKEGKIISLKERQGSDLKFIAFKIKHKLKEIFDRYLWPKNSLVLKGIILGERQEFPEDIKQAFIRTGTAHIIAISGFNVGIIVFILLIFLKVLGIKRKARFALTIPILIIHCVAVGSFPSVVRATIMAVILLISYLISQEAHILNSLSLSALVILAYNPLAVFDVGFQLSFVSVLGIVIISPKIISRFKIKIKNAGGKLFSWLLNGVSISFSAWLVTFAFIAYYFKIISPITIFANLIIVPLSSFIIILGFSLGLAGIACPLLTGPIAATTNLIMVILYKITISLSQIPFAYFYF